MEGVFTAYPSGEHRILSAILQLIAVVLLAGCLARCSPCSVVRLPHVPYTDTLDQLAPYDTDKNPYISNTELKSDARRRFQKIRLYFASVRLETTWTRITAYLTLLTSFIFALLINILVVGVGLDYLPLQRFDPLSGSDPAFTCYTAYFVCIVLYFLTKIFVYLFLIERVHVVTHAGAPTPRFSTKTYRFGTAAVLAYLVIFAFMIRGRIIELGPASHQILTSALSENGDMVSGICTLGLKMYASVPLLTYDVVVNIALTGLFVIPLITVDKLNRLTVDQGDESSSRSSKSGNRDEKFPRRPVMDEEILIPQCPHRKRLRSLAKRSSFAAFAALSISTINILVLTLSKGREAAWVFIAMCTTDITINALAVFSVIGNQATNHNDRRPSVPDIHPLNVLSSTRPYSLSQTIRRSGDRNRESVLLADIKSSEGSIAPGPGPVPATASLPLKPIPRMLSKSRRKPSKASSHKHHQDSIISAVVSLTHSNSRHRSVTVSSSSSGEHIRPLEVEIQSITSETESINNGSLEDFSRLPTGIQTSSLSENSIPP